MKMNAFSRVYVIAASVVKALTMERLFLTESDAELPGC